MTPGQTAAIIDIIGELWSITCQPPEKGGYSPRMIHELRDKLRSHSRESAEAILSAMRFEPGNQMRPSLDKFIARLNDVKRAEGMERNDGRVEREAARVDHQPFSQSKAKYADPDVFAAQVAQMNTREPGKGDAFARGCRWKWGKDYGVEVAT